MSNKSNKFSFKKASKFDSASESLPNTVRLNRLYGRLEKVWGDIKKAKQLKEELKEELKKSFIDKRIFEGKNTENINRIKDLLNIKASDYQKLKEEIVNEVNKVNKKTSASLQDTTFTKDEIKTIIESLRNKIKQKKKELDTYTYSDQYSKKVDIWKKINTFETNIDELQNYMLYDFENRTLKEIEARIPKYSYVINNDDARKKNMRRNTLKTVATTLTPYRPNGGTRRSKTRRSKTRKKSKKSITK